MRSPLSLSYHAVGQFSIVLSVRHTALYLLVRHRRGHDFTIYTHEHFRLPKTLRELLGKFMRQVGEIILAESDDKEISRDDVINITICIAQRTVERQTIQLSRLAADLMWFTA